MVFRWCQHKPIFDTSNCWFKDTICLHCIMLHFVTKHEQLSDESLNRYRNLLLFKSLKGILLLTKISGRIICEPSHFFLIYPNPFLDRNIEALNEKKTPDSSVELQCDWLITFKDKYYLVIVSWLFIIKFLLFISCYFVPWISSVFSNIKLFTLEWLDSYINEPRKPKISFFLSIAYDAQYSFISINCIKINLLWLLPSRFF